MFKQIKQSQSMFESKNKNMQSFAENVNISSSFSSEDMTNDKQSNSGIIIKHKDILPNSSQIDSDARNDDLMKLIIHKNISNPKPIMCKNSNSNLKHPIIFQSIGNTFEKWNKENMWEQNSVKEKPLIFMRRNINMHKQNFIKTNSMMIGWRPPYTSNKIAINTCNFSYIWDSYPEIFNNSRKSRVLLNNSAVKSSKWNIAVSIENKLMESFSIMNKRMQQNKFMRSNSLHKNFNKNLAQLDLKSSISWKSNENTKKRKQVRFADISGEGPLIFLLGSAILSMGDKLESKKLTKDSKVNTVPGLLRYIKN